MEEEVLSNEFDFGFVGGDLAADDVSAVPWLTDELLLVVSPAHRFARKRIVKKQDLQEERFIVRESGSATRATIIAQLQKADFQLETVIEMENPESVKKAVQSGLGVAFISKFAVETELKAKTLSAVRVRDLTIVRELKIVHRKDKHLSRAALAFIEMAHGKVRRDSCRDSRDNNPQIVKHDSLAICNHAGEKKDATGYPQITSSRRSLASTRAGRRFRGRSERHRGRR